jgi:cyclopropane fatty-acyl-phospholipid synthase-like methyltransferase
MTPFVSSLILFLAILLALYTEWYSRKSGIVPMPTLPSVRQTMLSSMPTSPNGDILELGSGWGGSLMALAKKYPNHRIIGYEMAPLPFYISQLRVRAARHKNVHLKRCDFYKESFDLAGAVFCYLSFQHMEKLAPKFSRELPSNTHVVSHAFPIPKKKAHKEYVIPGILGTTVYAYTYP